MYSIHKHFETNSDSLCTSWALFNLHKSVVFLKYANCIYFQICKFIETRMWMWMWMCMSVCVYHHHHHHFASGYTNRLKSARGTDFEWVYLLQCTVCKIISTLRSVWRCGSPLFRISVCVDVLLKSHGVAHFHL